MNNDGYTARGFDPDTAPDLSTDNWQEKFARAPVRRGRPPKRAAESIDYHPVVPRGHRPFPCRRARMADTDRPRPPQLDQAARRCVTRPYSEVPAAPCSRGRGLPADSGHGDNRNGPLFRPAKNARGALRSAHANLSATRLYDGRRSRPADSPALKVSYWTDPFSRSKSLVTLQVRYDVHWTRVDEAWRPTSRSTS